jgi:RNA polymerase sigma-70 factor (ECF subfamily)
MRAEAKALLHVQVLPQALPQALPQNLPSDEELMASHAVGDPNALGALFARYSGRLLHLMLRGLSAPEEARDLVQQTFLQLHRARADYDPAQRLRPWLYTIALNVKREYLRGRARRPTVALEMTEEPVAPGMSHERIEQADAVRKAVRTLPDDQRVVIELHWLDDLSFQEVAQCLVITPNAAKVRAHRGYVRLRERLEDARL